MLIACVEFVCKVVMQCKWFWKPWYKYFLKNWSQKVSGWAIGCSMDVGLESVQTDVLGRAHSRCREGTSSSLAWSGAQFGLPSIPCKPTLSGFPQNPPLDGVWDLWRVLLLVAHTGCRARGARLELEVRNEHLQGLARTEFCFVHILYQWRASGKLFTSNFDASFLKGTPTRSHDCRRSLLAETGSLTTLLPLPGFLSNFAPHSNLAKVLSTLFSNSGIPRKKELKNCTFTPRLVRLSSKIQWPSSSLPE